MPRKSRDVQRGLIAKGFDWHDSRHRRFVYVMRDGIPTRVRTVTSHGGNRDISDSLLATMARQCRVTRREFDQLIDCSMSREQYEELLSEGGRI